MKERNISIDILKFLAALLITNSHMGILYPNSAMATGGAIGNALFFFVSGFTLFLKPLGRFDEFYKKRINRIYPTVFGWAILETLFFDSNLNIINIILHGGRWFVTCIMVFYIFMYIINKTMLTKLHLVAIISLVILVIWFFILDKPDSYSMYGDKTFFRWGYYFLFMLLGGITGVSSNKDEMKTTNNFLKLILCIVLYYGILVFSKVNIDLNKLQIISVLPLFGLVLFLYQLGNSKFLKSIYTNKVSGIIIKIIGGLTLEIYLVQFSLISDKVNNLFPFNLIINFAIILIMAYILRCLSRVFSQTFKEYKYDWKAVFKLY